MFKLRLGVIYVLEMYYIRLSNYSYLQFIMYNRLKRKKIKFAKELGSDLGIRHDTILAAYWCRRLKRYHKRYINADKLLYTLLMRNRPNN